MHEASEPVQSSAPLANDNAMLSVRDIVRGGIHRFTGSEPMLRVPYDLYSPDGAIELVDGFAHYTEKSQPRTGSIARERLAAAKPGERVLLRIPPCSSDREWWLCEVEAVNGVVNE
jgi:hypothetical protein